MWKQYETTIKYHEIEISVQYSYSKGETQTHDYPGSPDQFEIENIWIESTEIYDLLSSDQLEDIENLVAETWE
jgi:hypothetical protein